MIRHSPACERNQGPILEVLGPLLARSTHVLEIAAGTGMHAVHMAPALPHLRWQPSDVSTRSLQSIRAWQALQPAENLAAPVALDVREADWPVEDIDAIFNANMIHISPWSVTEGLMSGAGRLLSAGGLLVMYGPYKLDGAHTAESNARFDQSLRAQDPSWGVRDLVAVMVLADSHGLDFEQRVQMPANNQIVVFRRR